MEEIPLHIPVTFIFIVVAAFGFLIFAAIVASPEKKDFTPTIIGTYIIVLLFVTAVLSSYGYYSNFNSTIPRIVVSVVIILGSLIVVFISRKGREFVQKMPLPTLTYIHLIRVPIAIVMWWLYKEGIVSKIMTFEGSNYDIIAGITAPFAGLFLVGMRSKSRLGAIVWNIVTMALLINWMYLSVLSAPFPFQRFSFEQPNIAVFSFPYTWMHTFVVPAILFCHVASIFKLFTVKEDTFN